MLKINREHKFREFFPKISAYTTVYNCINGGYPFEKAIKSFSWVDELVVVDGGSTDSTRQKLENLQQELSNLQIFDIEIDWENPGKDGHQKAMARAMCSNEFLIQFDADELCCGDPELWKRYAKNMPEEIDILELFVAEPFGDISRLRIDKSHNPLKWRIYRNKPEITHGIPIYDRLEIDGKTYSKGYSDGCFPIHIVTNQLYDSSCNEDLFKLKQIKYKLDDINLQNNISDLEVVIEYKKTVKEIMSSQPFVLHLGHIDLEKKIELYLTIWHKFWCHLYNKDFNDPNNNLYFPGILPEEILKNKETLIKEKVEQLKINTPTILISELMNLI